MPFTFTNTHLQVLSLRARRLGLVERRHHRLDVIEQLLVRKADLPHCAVHVARLVDAERRLALQNGRDAGLHVVRDSTVLWVGHQIPRAEDAGYLPHRGHRVGGRDALIKVDLPVALEIKSTGLVQRIVQSA